jgi:hypothetical protein
MNLTNTIEYGILFTLGFLILLVLAAGILLYLKVPPYMYYVVFGIIYIIYSYTEYAIKSRLNTQYHLGLANISPSYHTMAGLVSY